MARLIGWLNLHLTLSALTPEQYRSMLLDPNSKLAGLVRQNVAAGWVFFVLPVGALLNSHERVGDKLLLHLVNDGRGAITCVIPAEPGIWNLQP